MLATAGVAAIDDLFEQQVPSEFILRQPIGLPSGLSEMEVAREMAGLASANRTSRELVSFMGGGIYDHFVPSAVGALAGRGEFLTAYTPYQPEASQGTLQAFFEFQTMVARLMAMDVANASLYDGASAAGEAVYMALELKPQRRRVVVSSAVHPDTRALIATYLRNYDAEVVEVPTTSAGVTDPECLAEFLAGAAAACVVAQQPNYFGCLEDMAAIGEAAHAAGALLVASCDPVSLGLLSPPGEYGADIAIAEGQGIGLRPYAVGETVGLFTCRKDFMRRMPGRLVGLTKDSAGRRGFVLTLQTREQHIRREKATSNICTNHAHNALRVAIHLSLLGPSGLARVARLTARNTARLRAALETLRPGSAPFAAPCFKEFVVRTKGPARQTVAALVDKGYLAGVPLDALGDAPCQPLACLRNRDAHRRRNRLLRLGAGRTS